MEGPECVDSMAKNYIRENKNIHGIHVTKKIK